jgi:hypothetical protein
MMVGTTKGSDLPMEDDEATQERIFEVMINYVVRADSASRGGFDDPRPHEPNCFGS